LAALGRLSTGWLVKLDNERKAREAEAAKEAAAAAAAALAARQEAETTTDIAVVEDAQDKMAEAMSLIKQAQSIGKAKVKVRGRLSRADSALDLVGDPHRRRRRMARGAQGPSA
jgi:hypothetical protein